MMTQWIDQTDGTRWTGVARIASIDCEIVLERTEDSRQFRIMRDYGGDKPRVFLRGLPEQKTFIGAMFAAVATVQMDIDAVGGESALQPIASPGSPGKPE